MQRGLSDVVPRIGLDAPAKFLSLGRRAVRTDQHSIPTGFADGFNHVAVQAIEHVFALGRIAA